MHTHSQSCSHMFSHTYTDTLPFRHAHWHTCTHWHTHTDTHTHTDIRTLTCTHWHTHTDIHTLTYMHTLTHMHTLTYTLTHMRPLTYTLTCMHTHTHTHTHIDPLVLFCDTTPVFSVCLVGTTTTVRQYYISTVRPQTIEPARVHQVYAQCAQCAQPAGECDLSRRVRGAYHKAHITRRAHPSLIVSK